MEGLALKHGTFTARKMKFSIKDFFSKCDLIHRKLRIWSHLLKKSFVQNFIICPVIKTAFANNLLAAHEICLKSKLQTLNLLYTLVKNFIFNFRIYKIFFYPLRFADFCSNEFTSTFAAFSHTKHFHCFILQEVA